ncbi:SusC/RagA family TonB-linked outer membrane protein [Maribellus sp. CM-23]|uniref:SusC/RagA family TonB-linked outer membrane protein n=1 Tax=Maribellus sp. CM-23 TaxID=2781026 RepID=UPI001F4875CC|nr:SusC/RagA family TonB-linked outer membrane protein [Maribellus sp. CM-23]MCE4562825.1 SusC/RagA family TonB-linked outer membrane protein [Maribellus sp. CM-23]
MKKRIQKMLLTALFAVMCSTAFSQVNVSGTVSSEEGELLPGVSILIKGTNTGVITDIDGKYSLNSVLADATLVFSFVGMRTQEVAIDGRAVVNVTMQMSAVGVDEVVVTALGMKKEKRALGYNISSVNSDEIESGGVSNALKSLEGKITGVQMNSLTSSPTSSVMFNIRGATSLAGIMKGKSGNINNETQPLIVVDGVPVATNSVGTTGGIDVGNYMSSINPNDIESVSVLKGASAAALYGSQAGNGVILITTKSGSGAKKGIGVSVSSSVSFDQAYSAPPVQRRFFQGDEDGSPLTDDKKGLGWAIDDKVNNNEPVWRWNLLTQEWEQSVLEVRGDKNPLLAFLETGVMFNNDIAITGNYDKGNYRLNLGNLRSNSVVPSNKTIRNNVSFSAAYNLTNKITVSSQASYSHTFVPNQSHIYGKREDNPLAHAMSMPINMPTMDVWKQANRWLNDWDGTYQNTPYLKNPGEDRLSRVNSSGFDKAIGKNGPYFAAEEVIRTYTKDVVFGKVQMDWKLTEPLTLTLRSGLSHESFAFERKTPWGSERAEKGGYEQRHSNSLGIKNDVMLAYSNYFMDEKLSVDALAGLAYNYDEANSSGFGGNELATPNSFSYNSLPASVRQSASFYRGYSSRNYGVYGTVTLGWKSMLYLELTGRNDWVGILDHEKDNHFYPGVSLSWIATETFPDMGDWIDLLKLRGGYAQTGYGIGNPVNLDSYGISGSTWGGIAMGTVGGSLVDADIDPELNETKEIGVDFSFAENRIFGEFTAYSKNHINQIQNLPVVGSSGFGSVLTNMGSVKSTGIEASLTVVPVRNKNWTWSVTGNITSFKSVIEELDDRFSEKFYSYEGSALLSLFKGSKVGDLYAESPIARIQSGKYKGMMLTGIEGIIEESVQTTDYIKENGYLGNMNPDAILGFSTDVKYKNWNLGIVTSLRLGGVFISETQKIMIDDGMADIADIYKDKYDEYWTGGRFAGGLPGMPSPDAIFPGAGWEEYRDTYSGYMEYYNGDPRYFGYWNAVFINPNMDLSGLSPEEKLNLPDEYYVKNGEDPLYTMYTHPYYMEGQELWSGAQFRTWDATNFKIKEINLTYRFNKALVNKLYCQDIAVTAFAKNVMFWAKNRMNEDPETAFRDGISGMGVSQFGLPPIRTMGLRVAVNF